MNLSVTFRHMEATDAIKDYAKDKIEKIKRYFPDPITAHVVLTTERGYQHTADVVITSHNGLFIKGRESTEDMYSSIDLVMAKIERQVRRYKERIRDHKPHTGEGVPIRATVLSAEVFDRESSKQPRAVKQQPGAKPPIEMPPPQVAAVQIVKSSKFFAKPMTVEEAVMQMNLLGNEFLVFMDQTAHQVAVVYKRKDGNYGLIETGIGSAVEAETKAS